MKTSIQFLPLVYFLFNLLIFDGVGFNMEEVAVKNIKFVVWDVGGQKKVYYIFFWFNNVI
jgi:hypothetical protein